MVSPLRYDDCLVAFCYAAREVEAWGGEVIFSDSGPPNIQSLGYDDVAVVPYVLACSRHVGSDQSAETLLAPAPRDGVDDLILGACSLCPAVSCSPCCRLIRLDHCLELFIGPEQLMAATHSGAYVITPGWLRQWPAQMRRWGFDQETARQFFHEFSRELLLLDTGIDPQAPAELEGLATFLDLPYRVSFVENAHIFHQMRLSADTDPLTRLHNRRRFTELAEVEFKRAVRYGDPLSVIFIDIDHFKRVNDTFGHVAGDQVLEQVAARLRQVRTSDLVARYGGEEFVVISSATGLPNAEVLGERLCQIVGAQPIETLGGPVSVTISVGVASIEPGIAALSELIQRADQALYRAKLEGRNRVCVWSEG